jgi:GTPase SAR1 family protein
MSIKVVVMGESGTGKTSFIKRLKYGEFVREHKATLGSEVHPISDEDVTLDMWDTAGDKKFMGSTVGNYIGADVGIVFATEETLDTI